jgi:hypothetical protein
MIGKSQGEIFMHPFVHVKLTNVLFEEINIETIWQTTYRHYEEVEVGDSPELLEKVEEPKVVDGVFRASDMIRREGHLK